MFNESINGVINVYKEKGFTSHDVVAKLRGILKTKKIGHTGTLDPDAEGVLPVCIGNATKLCDFIMDKTKTYRTKMLLGMCTDTQDLSGNVIARREIDNSMTEEQIKNVIMGFKGEYNQVPPMYSALKVNGKKLYELARQGIEVKREPRKVIIYSIQINSIEIPYIDMTVSCSKGTYIRTLCNDIGENLNVYGCMCDLIRVKTGPFLIEDSIKLSQIEKMKNDNSLHLEDIIKPTDFLLSEYQALSTKKEANRYLYNGNVMTKEMFESGNMKMKPQDQQLFRIYDSNGIFCAIYEYQDKTSIYKANKMFLS